MNLSQLILQLGVAGLLIWVFYQVAMKWLDRWSESEREKNATIAEGFRNVTQSVNAHSAADIASHERLAESHGEVREAVTRVEAKLDTLAGVRVPNGVHEK